METKPTNLFYTQQFLTIAGIFYVTSLSPAIDKWIDGILTPKEAKQLANAALVSMVGGFLKLGDPKVYTPNSLPGRNKEVAVANIAQVQEIQKVDNTVQDVSAAIQSLNPLSTVNAIATGKNPFDSINHASEDIGHFLGISAQNNQSAPPLQIKAITTTKYKEQPVESSILLPTQYRTIEKNAIEGMKIYSPVVNNHVEFTGYDDHTWYAFAPDVVLVENNKETPFISMTVRYPTQDQLSQVYGNTVSDAQYADFIKCCDTFGISTHEDICQFMAQTAHESGGLQYMKEIGDYEYFSKNYDYRDDLGNTQEGDGAKYSGVSPLQMTGRHWYTEFAAFVNDPRVLEGVDYVAEHYIFQPSGFWWYKNNISQAIKDGADIRKVSQLVNGVDPANGLDSRIDYYNRAKDIFI